ncbi:MAG TPA: hypothetical protein VFR72_02435 [Gemmatimonadales bacterium]|nr:hypothetical protein [Gemmatimonadales bacterium]
MTATWRISGLMLLAACGGGNAAQGNHQAQADPQVQACAPVEAGAEAVAADELGGRYTLRMVATSGAKPGSSAEGQMELMPNTSAGDSPMHGTAELDFASVGAVVPGDPKSSDPLSPGVLVLEGSSGVMLRVGSEANRKDVRRFDGAYTALQVTQVTDQGFAGTWRSGLGTEESEGHFCAVRSG